MAVGTNVFLGLHIETNPSEESMLSTATDLVYLDPAAPFMSSLSLAFYGGILLAFPFIFYFLAQFILPALKVKEKKYVLRACAIGSGLFLTGVFDSISVVIRLTLEQILTPDTLRGRVSAIHYVFIGFSNEFGAFESGATAALLGPVLSVAGGGLAALLVVALVGVVWPELARLGPLASLEPLED